MQAPAASDADRELVARWSAEPAPLLPLLHAFHERDGFLSEDALRAVAEGLRVPLADLWGTVTFYHHFAREPGGRAAPRVCDGPICRLHGADALLAALAPEGAHAMPCAGRCDEPVPVLRGARVLVGASAGALVERDSPLPPPNPEGREECCFAGLRDPARRTLAGYRASGGYAALERALGEPPEALLATLEESGLAGRGGAGFPTARKWRAVREAPLNHPPQAAGKVASPKPPRGGRKAIVCNADEGEPGCFKDRVLMDHDPHALLEGMALAAHATGATLGIVYLRYEYPRTQAILERAIEEARAAGLLGRSILGSGLAFDVCVRRGAGAYICGEETSLLNSLEGQHPFPRNKPPYPVTHGFEDEPTVVNNVETLCSVPPIVARGARWYAGLGLAPHKGTKIVSLSGDVRRPGNYEVPIGLPLATLLERWAGGPPPGRAFQAVTMAGLSGGFLSARELDATLDEPCLRARGSFLGAGGIMVFDDSRDMVEIARQAMAFFAHESCGKCFPCRIGTQRLTERLGGLGPRDPDAWRREVRDIGRTMMATSACGLGLAAPLVTESLLERFPERVAEHLRARAGAPGDAAARRAP